MTSTNMASIQIVSQLLQESVHYNDDNVHKSNYTQHDRSVLCDIDPDLNYDDPNNIIVYCIPYLQLWIAYQYMNWRATLLATDSDSDFRFFN